MHHSGLKAWFLLQLVSFLQVHVLAQQGEQQFNEVKFNRLIEKVEADAIELARTVEELYLRRCELALLADCVNGSYEHCLSSYPDETCPGGDDFNAPECGDGITCSKLYSFSVSSVVLPAEVANGPNRNPTDPQAIETVCFTQGLDEYIAAKRAEDESFWDELGFQPNNMYFGSANGVFRILPAQHYKDCNVYDPRIRPWYVAASSGPKNLFMVLDHSGSMRDNGKIDVLREAAIRVVNTSTVGDRIAVIVFNDMATQFTNKGFVYIASQDNKDALVEQIENLEAWGGTNFYDAFTATFDILDSSIADEAVVNCNTAILFLTDGLMTLPEDKTEQDIIDLVEQRMNATSQKLDEPIYLFTYSVSGGDPEIDEFPKMLACSTGTGVWSKIEYEEDIVDSLSSYYKFFALGLGSGSNEDFTAWVEPYVYIPGDTVGTTVSSPVYDRTKEPHLFLGVVGIDFTLDALDAALGITSSDSKESFNRVVQRSTARCPRLELSTCELESYRRQSSVGDEALCGDTCGDSDFVQIEEKKCPAVNDYPRDLWINRDKEFLSYLDTACCRVGETVPDNTCIATDEVKSSSGGSGTSAAVIAGSAAGGGAFLLALVIFFVYSKKKQKGEVKKAEKAEETETHHENTSSQQSPTISATATDGTPIIVPSASPVYTASVQGSNLDINDQCRAVPVSSVSSPTTHQESVQGCHLDYKDQFQAVQVSPVASRARPYDEDSASGNRSSDPDGQVSAEVFSRINSSGSSAPSVERREI